MPPRGCPASRCACWVVNRWYCSWRAALQAGAREVWVATDDQRIADALSGLAEVKVAMTATTHASGTDRLAECARIAGWADDTVVVNLQGDEPFAPATGIRAVADALVAGTAPMSTLATTVEDAHTCSTRTS